MVKNGRKGMLFAGGLLLGVVAGAVGMMSLRGGDGPYASSPPATHAVGAQPSTAFVTAVAGNCEMAPMLPNGDAGDGRETLQAKPDDASASEVGSLILSGKEAAASGRQRDAEVDFLNACRNAATLTDGNPIPLADAMYQLGRHYATVAALGAPKSTELFQRAERLYSASLEAYRARYGDKGEKTRFAQEGLATVQQATGGKAPALIAKAPPPPAAAAAAAAPAPAASASVAAASAPSPAPAAVAAAAPAPVAAAPRPRPAPRHEAPRPVEADNAPPPPRTAVATVHDNEDAPPVVQPRPRPQARRAPPREAASDMEDDVAVDAPPPRRPRPVYVTPAAPRTRPDTATAGYGSVLGNGPAQAEGSPNAP